MRLTIFPHYIPLHYPINPFLLAYHLQFSTEPSIAFPSGEEVTEHEVQALGHHEEEDIYFDPELSLNFAEPLNTGEIKTEEVIW